MGKRFGGRWRPDPFAPSEPRLVRWARDLATDLRYALRQARTAPGTMAFMVATLAVGIGANVTMTGIVDRLVLRAPPGISEPDRLVRPLEMHETAPIVGGYGSYPQFLRYAREVEAFEGVAASATTTLAFGVGADARPVSALMVSSSYFRVLGVRPALGRTFGPEDGFPTGATPGGPALAVLAHGFWRRQLGGDARVVGRTVRVGGLAYTVVGIAPPGFRGVGDQVPDLWLPITVAAEGAHRRFVLEDRGRAWLSLVARVRPGTSHAVAEAQATVVSRSEAGHASADGRSRVVLAPVVLGRGPDAPREVRVALWLGGVSALVLLIACANVANLLLARGVARRREIAVRLALGASRGRLARQLLAEAGLLAAAGGGAALLLAMMGGGLARRYFSSAAVADGTSFVDGRLLATLAAIALGTGAVVGLAPLVQSAVPDLTRALRAGGGTAGRRARARTLLLGAQSALCMLLLVVAGLFAQSLRRVEGIDLGASVDRTLLASFDLDGALLSRPQVEGTYADLVARVRAIPGVRGAALASGDLHAVMVHTRDRDVREILQRTADAPFESAVDAGYFRTLGTSLRGRDFTSADVAGAPRVAILNAPLARALFPDGDALGQCVHLNARANERGGDCWTVVGVLQGYWYRRSILKREGLLVYVPRAQRIYGLGRPKEMVVALDAPAPLVLPAVRRALLETLPAAERVQVRSMRAVVEPELRPWQLGATMLSLMGAVALVIAAVGLYAVVAFTAAQRTSEIAVRVALGARARDVVRTVAGDGLGVVAIGLATGAGAALALRRWIAPMLFETSPSDPAVVAATAGMLLAVALLAVLVPVARALRTSPAAALRLE